MQTVERNAAGAMSIKQASMIVYGTQPTNAILFEEARKVVMLAARSGYKFSTRGDVTPPAYHADEDADNDERRYAEA